MRTKFEVIKMGEKFAVKRTTHWRFLGIFPCVSTDFASYLTKGKFWSDVEHMDFCLTTEDAAKKLKEFLDDYYTVKEKP